MVSEKRKYRWLAGGLSALVLILVILALLLPWVVNLESVRGKILAGASQAVGGQVDYEKIDLSLFPRPHLVIYQGSMSIPGKISGRTNSFAVYPEVLPLFIGTLRISQVHVKDPVFTYEVGEERPAKTTEKPEPLSAASILKDLDPFMALLASKSPNLDVKVENGRITLAMQQEVVFHYRYLRAQNDVPEGKMAIDVTDFNIAFAGLADQQAEKQSPAAHKVMPAGDKKLVIRGKSLRTVLDASEDKATLSLDKLNLDHPQLNMAGKLVVQKTSPEISLELAARELDIHSTRQVTLALAGNDPTVRDIFDIMRGGQLPLITFSSHGRVLAELDDTEHMVIEGDLVDGKVSISGVDLHMEGVNGQTRISKGILTGKNLDARLGNTQAHNGTLKVGLEGEDAPFHLDIRVDADLAQLPPILKRVVEDKTFLHELNLVDHLEGNGAGRLVLGESMASIDAIVDVSEFTLSAKYQRTPFPLEINGGAFHYDDTRVSLDKVGVKLGQSSLSDLSAGLDLNKAPHLKVELGRSKISLGEIFPWLLSLGLHSDMRKDFRSVTGTLLISARLDGPLLQPNHWRYQSRGEVRNLSLDTSLLPWPVTVTRGSYDLLEKGTEQRFSLKDFQVSAMDGSLSASGVVKDYMKKGVNNADTTFQGELGPEATRWVSELIDLPREIYIRPPLSISKGHLIWEKSGKTSFVGDLVVHQGPKVSIDFLQTPEELAIKNLRVQDKNSDFSSSLSLKEKEMSLAFTGKLTEKTLREIHRGYDLLHGRVEGDFRTRIFLDQPMRSTAQGRLMAKDIILPLDLKRPIKIGSISLAALENKVKIESGVCTVGDTTFELAGTLSSAKTDLLVDMDISTDLLDLNQIAEGLGDDIQPQGGKEGSDNWDLPLQGTLRLKAKNLTYEGYTWSPVNAHISLNPDSLVVGVTEADLCGISTTGNLGITTQNLRLDFEPVAKNHDLDSTLDCLWGTKKHMTGHFDLDSKVMAQGSGEDIVSSSQGNIEFQATEGRIYLHEEFGVLGKIFTRLSLTEMFTGQIPDMKTEGFPYKTATIKAKLEGGKLSLEEAYIDGLGMQVFGHGNVDLVNENLDLEVAVAPFKTVDTVVNNTPIFGKIMGGTLVSVPVKVSGHWSDPEVAAIPASSVGSGLLGIIKRTVELPVEMVQPLVNGEKEK